MFMNQLDVVKASEIFLIPSSILVGALGVARTEGLKSGISALGLLLTLLWIICRCGAYGAAGSPIPWRLTILTWMPALFLVSWGISLVLHVKNYKKRKEKLLNNSGTIFEDIFVHPAKNFTIENESGVHSCRFQRNSCF